MKVVGWVLGLLGLAGVIVMSVAGVTGATATLVTATAIAGMIALGSLMGGRTTPNREPYQGDTDPGSQEAVGGPEEK